MSAGILPRQGRRACPFDYPQEPLSEFTPFEALHHAAACLAFDASKTDGIGGTERMDESMTHNLLTDTKRVVEIAAEVQRLAVWAARDHGMSWADIGSRFGISRQAAQQRFGGAK